MWWGYRGGSHVTGFWYIYPLPCLTHTDRHIYRENR
jgi:hypothetical protein